MKIEVWAKEVYNKIIERAKARNIKIEFGETHHVIPISICKYLDIKSELRENKVVLTSREHFICHCLLCYIYRDYHDKTFYIKMLCALNNMKCNRYNYRYVNSRIYERFKRELIDFSMNTVDKNTGLTISKLWGRKAADYRLSKESGNSNYKIVNIKNARNNVLITCKEMIKQGLDPNNWEDSFKLLKGEKRGKYVRDYSRHFNSVTEILKEIGE